MQSQSNTIKTVAIACRPTAFGRAHETVNLDLVCKRSGVASAITTLQDLIELGQSRGLQSGSLQSQAVLRNGIRERSL
jgi:hypothetical protein